MAIIYIKSIYETQNTPHRDLLFLMLQSTLRSMAAFLKRHRHDKNAKMAKSKTTSKHIFTAMPMALGIISIMATSIIELELEPQARHINQIL
jgi:hypothetical protein